jgi:hypothetical protein
MTLEKGANSYADQHGRDDPDRARLTAAYRAGYLQAVTNWVNKARD